MVMLSVKCREMEALRKRIQRSFGMDRMTEQQYNLLRDVHQLYGLALDLTGNPEKDLSGEECDELSYLIDRLRDTHLPIIEKVLEVKHQQWEDR